MAARSFVGAVIADHTDGRRLEPVSGINIEKDKLF